MLLSRLLALAFVFAPLSVLAFGGGVAIIPEIQHQAVTVHHWLAAKEFADLFGLSRAAPGPSTLVVALIGWQVAGLAGATVATVAIFLPSSILVYAASTWWNRNEHSPLREAIERGLAPIAVGMFFAAPVVILRSAHAGWFELLTTAVVCLTLSRSRVGPYLVAASVVLVYLAVYATAGALA